jgi:hypothetical protein
MQDKYYGINSHLCNTRQERYLLYRLICASIEAGYSLIIDYNNNNGQIIGIYTPDAAIETFKPEYQTIEFLDSKGKYCMTWDVVPPNHFHGMNSNDIQVLKCNKGYYVGTLKPDENGMGLWIPDKCLGSQIWNRREDAVKEMRSVEFFTSLLPKCSEELKNEY